MAIARQTDETLVRPLEGHVARRFTAGSAVAVGEIVAMAADGEVDPANTTSAGVLARPIGIAIQAAAAGERFDVVVFGPIVCVTGASPGAIVYGSDTAGEPSESAGTVTAPIGWAESATVVFVRPEIT